MRKKILKFLFSVKKKIISYIIYHTHYIILLLYYTILSTKEDLIDISTSIFFEKKYIKN
jgi:hypothetical protein